MRVFTKCIKLIIGFFLISLAGRAQESLNLYDIQKSRLDAPPVFWGFRLDVMDFNGDGQDDISYFFGETASFGEKSAFTNFNAMEVTDEVLVLHDSLMIGPEYATPILRDVYAADFTGDGKQEIMVAYYQEAFDDFSYHMNEILMYKYSADDGGYIPEKIFNENRTASVTAIQQMAIGDFNADGHLDLILDYNNTNKTTLFINDGKGKFTQKALNGGYFLEQVRVADLNGDGFDDVIARAKSTASNTPKFMVKYMTDGIEKAFSDLQLTSDENWVVPGDFDNDGDVDLAGRNVYLNDGNGNFTLSLESSYACLFRVGDMDGNGDEELYVSDIDENNNVYIVILDYIDQAWHEVHRVRAENMFSLVTGDFDGDGKDEFAGYNTDEFEIPQFLLYNDIPIVKPEVNVTGFNTTSINLSWVPQEKVPQYLVDVATDAEFTNLLPGYEKLPYENTGTSIAASISGLSEGETYYYRVRPYLREQFGPAYMASFVAGEDPTQQPLSLDDLQYDKNLVFPNPVQKGQSLTINRSNPDIRYQLTTLQGNSVMHGNGSLLNIQNLNSGMYLLKVLDGNKKSVSKIIVQ